MVYVILGEGFEEIEALAPIDILRRGDVQVSAAGIGGLEVTGGHGIRVRADCLLEDVDLDGAEMIVVPGGQGGVKTVEETPAALELLKRASEKGKLLAAICAGPRVLVKAGLMEGRRCVCYPTQEQFMDGARVLKGPGTVRDGDIITATGAATAMDFGFELLAALKGEEAADEVAAKMLCTRQGRN